MKKLIRWLRPLRGRQEITIVSGLPRSGTSMMMKMLEAGGIPPLTDAIREADEDNPKGYYEFERVKKLKEGDTDWLPDARGKAVKVISALLKYLPSDYRYKVIFMERDMAEVLASQRKMLARRGKRSDEAEDAAMAQHFERHLQEVKRWLEAQPNIEVLYVHYGRVIQNPLSDIERLNVFLGGNLDTRAMAQVIDPNLYRNRRMAS